MTEYTPEMARAAVEQGAAWLSEHCPDWLSHINMEQLNLQSTTSCVLGQTADCLVGTKRLGRGEPGFWRVRREMGITDDRWTALHGFDVPDAEVDEYGEDGDREYGARYEMLTLTWREYIREQQSA